MEAILKSISAISSREVIDDEKMLTIANDFHWLSEQDVIILNTMEKELEYYEDNVLKTTAALSFITYPAYMIIESTTDGIDKVTSRVLSQTSLDSENYVPYAGWSTGHKESAAWSSDSSYHYHVCANGCGKKYASYAHNWVQYSGYRKCSVCGYQMSI